MLTNKAIFPVAGLGTRFLPATKAQPKEMLPDVDKPLIQYAVEEAYAAGVRQMIFVSGRHKRALEDHFDLTLELQTAVEPEDMPQLGVRQAQALGLGPAVLCARHGVGDNPLAGMLPDALMLGRPPI